jgi:hypothetical protein
MESHGLCCTGASFLPLHCLPEAASPFSTNDLGIPIPILRVHCYVPSTSNSIVYDDDVVSVLVDIHRQEWQNYYCPLEKEQRRGFKGGSVWAPDWRSCARVESISPELG